MNLLGEILENFLIEDIYYIFSENNIVIKNSLDIQHIEFYVIFVSIEEISTIADY